MAPKGEGPHMGKKYGTHPIAGLDFLVNLRGVLDLVTARSRQEPPGAARGRQEPPGAARSNQLQGAARTSRTLLGFPKFWTFFCQEQPGGLRPPSSP